MSNIEENYFPELCEKISKEFPEGMMFDYCGIEFYVKYYSSNDEFFNDFAEYENNRLYISCEYFDSADNCFKEKYFSEEFLRNRIKVLTEGL